MTDVQLQPVQPTPRVFWTPDEEDRLRKLWDDGLSASQIGQQMGLSRSAVLGKAHRLDLPTRLSAHPATVERRRRRLMTREEKAAYQKRAYAARTLAMRFRRSVPTMVEITEADDVEQPPDFKGIGLLDLEPHHCRFPAGEGSAITFCGCPVVSLSYCDYHDRIAHTSPVRRGFVHRLWVSARKIG